MGNKNVLIIIAAVAVIIVSIVGGVVLLNRRQVSVPGTGVAGTTAGQVDGDSADAPVSQRPPAVNGERVLCGDGVCSPTESLEICKSDCTPRDVFTDVRADFSNDRNAVISWMTTRPMTSVVEYGEDDSFSGGTETSDILTTEHRIELSGLQRGLPYVVRLKGVDAEGNEETWPKFWFE